MLLLKYKILASADYHWGAMEAERQYKESMFIIDYIKKNKIDLFVICGDYFDHRLLVNSKSAFNAMKFMDELKRLSIQNEFKIVVFDGTESHDYDQLEIFRPFEDSNFKIFRKTSVDETLPGLRCLYAPDENITTNDYIAKYSPILFSDNLDIMFFHGTFDTIMVDRSLDDDIPNVIFEYSFYNRITNLMVGGHWHNGDNYGNMYYTRSPYRWKYEEDLPKGIISIEYDTDNKSYNIDRIENTDTDTYYSFYVDTSLYTNIDQYSNLLNKVTNKLSEGAEHVRIKITITDDKELNKSCIETIINKFQGHKQVKVVTENKYTKQLKKKRREEIDSFKNKFKYIFDENNSLSKIYKTFIYDTKGVDIPEETIASIIDDICNNEGK